MHIGCGLPPEYCEWSGREFDLDDCKKWLAETHPDLFESIYPPADDDEESFKRIEIRASCKLQRGIHVVLIQQYIGT